MDFNLPQELTAYLGELDRFIEAEIEPLELQDDNIRFFDHRREWARTEFDNGGLPRPEREELMRDARRRADKAGHLPFALPREFGGKDGSILWMTVIREHRATFPFGCLGPRRNEMDALTWDDVDYRKQSPVRPGH